MTELTIVYDAACALCVRCRAWLESERSFVRLRFVAAASPEAAARFGGIPWTGAELVVVSDAGDVWVGPAAFLVALWALERWREWSYRLSGPAFAPFAERFFQVLSSRRGTIAALLGPVRCDVAGGACTLPEHRPPIAYR